MGEMLQNQSDKLGEECGVFGMYDFDAGDVASSIYYGLLALQHRGQESCGIAVSETGGPKGKVSSYKEMGLVNETFTPEILEKMKGDIGVGHDNRYFLHKYPSCLQKGTINQILSESGLDAGFPLWNS